MKILIVEDEEMIADIISAGLTRTGYQCECVYDGAEAAGLLEEKRYDLILLDIMLPGADGYELMEYIKNYNTPVIFITARTRLEDKVRGFKLGADDYITKPFDLSVLKTKIAAIINNRRLYRKKYIDKSAFSDETSVINELDRKFMYDRDICQRGT